MISDFFMDLYNIAYPLIVDIPVNNIWGILYVVAKTVLSFALSIFGYTSNGGIFPSF